VIREKQKKTKEINRPRRALNAQEIENHGEVKSIRFYTSGWELYRYSLKKE